jgi:LDH2 family malate/lactate/ureidoglycolate dehydrogenase
MSTPVPVQQVEAFCVDALARCGVSEVDARLTADVLVTTDTWGVLTHGTKLLRGYVKRLRGGGINPQGRPRVVTEGPAWAVIDGDSSLGMVSSVSAMRTAIAKAKAAGIGFVTVRNSCHFGAAGYYANLAVQSDMVGQAMANDCPSVTAPGSRGPVLGSNPFAFAAPAGREKPILLDIATAAVAGGKVYIAQTRGEPIPANWLVDANGVPTTDPKGYPQTATLMPMAGHKGYGLALMIETLSGLMSGGCVTREIGSWIFGDAGQPSGHGHAFMALDIGAMTDLERFKARMDGLIREIKAAPKAQGTDRIYLPGEKEWEHRDRALARGIEFPEDVKASLRGLAGDLGMNVDWLG